VGAAECIERVGLNQQQADEPIIEAAKTGANIVMKNIVKVRTIADLLEQKKRIEGDEIRDIVRRQKDATIRS
jgi:ATP-dependent Zn protease